MATFLKQIEAAHKKRGEILTALETLVKAAEDDGERKLTEEEDGQFKTLKKELGDHDDRLTKLQETEDLLAANSKRIEAEKLPDQGSSGIVIQRDTRRPKVKGAFFARQAHLLYLAGGNRYVAAEIAEKQYGDKEMGAVLRVAVAPAMTTTVGWAAELVQQEVQDFIDMLRPMSVYSRIPAGSTVDFGDTNSVRIPRQTTGIAGGFVLEGAAIPVAQGVFDSILLTPKKLGVITVATNEMLMRSTPALETILRDSMLRDTATVLDRRFLSSQAAAAGAPAGIFHATNAVAAIAASATGNAADDAIADLNALMGAFFTSNVPQQSPVWVMHPSKRLALSALRTAVGVWIFRDELTSGNLAGFPVLDTTVFDFGLNNGGASNTDAIGLIDSALLIKGTGMAPAIALSDDATVHMETVPATDLAAATPTRSMFQTDSTALRLTYEAEWRTRHTLAVQHIANVGW